MAGDREPVRTVAITGASAGVGRATAREFAGPGTRLGLIARGSDGLEAARREAAHRGADTVAVTADVADAGQVEDAAARIERELGPLDVWVNNAMVSVFSPVAEMTPAEYRRVTEVTYLGYVWGTMAALRRMLPRDSGRIVQVGSALAYRAIPLQSAYCASKHAIQGFTEALRSELCHEDSAVTVTMVQLPALNTPQFDWVRNKLPHRGRPVPPIYQPEVAARAVEWASRTDRSEIHVGGSTVKTILADRVAPRALDRWLARQGYEAQQTDELEDPDRPDNLRGPLPGDRGARGRFDDRARGRSLQLEASMRRGWIVLGGAVLAAGLGLLLARNR